jgi:hypothetical protein
MSNPYSSPQAPQYYQPPQENTLGLVGFIASIIGLFFCIAAPIGLIISLLGLRQQPKGFAIAGSIIGGITTLFYLAIVALYGAVIAACIGVGVAAQPMMQTAIKLDEARHAIENGKTDGVYPSQAEGGRIIAGKADYWETPLRYEPTDGGYVIRSAGPDKQFNTSDDMTVDDFGSTSGMPDFDEPGIPFEMEEPESTLEPSTEPTPPEQEATSP